MKGYLLLSERGLILLDGERRPVAVTPFTSPTPFVSLQLGERVPELDQALKTAKEQGYTTLTPIPHTLAPLLAETLEVEEPSPELEAEISTRRLGLMVEVGVLGSEEEGRALVREAAIELVKATLRRATARLDLQVAQAVEALDDLDKAINLLEGRLKEWYGVHFPELEGLFKEGLAYARLVAQLGGREAFTEEALKEIGIVPRKAEVTAEAAFQSKGGEVREEELQVIRSLAEELVHLHRLRERVASKIEGLMEEVAPNLARVAGPTVGARLIAKAGSLEGLAKLPASTIQVLGAEKALFRALKTGSKPPKHGIIFQHQAVHSAPRWQRGKVARSLAAKIAIAARIDLYRGEAEAGLEERLKRRIEEIKVKYSEPPKRVKRKRKAEAKPPRRRAKRRRVRRGAA